MEGVNSQPLKTVLAKSLDLNLNVQFPWLCIWHIPA